MVVLHTSSLAEFDRLKSANTYLVADFYADWCGPCHAIKPMYENLANTHGQPGQLVFVKVNVDSATDIARRYGVTAMPTFMFFENGQPYNGGRSVIRGADPRSLTTTVQELSQLAKKKSAEAAAAAAKKAEAEKRKREEAEKAEAKPDDGSTVSGGYTLGGDGGKRSDWKMSLR
ncbi:thioredoxin-like protein [Colletotrichum truncatum]|uniref:Thioredoxin-like protein n=1 Tax=Colletotrichum truncatum TaxID=5467 RepID=A0ACC3YI28_COLTU|nr:thioredoxin-like protein [Colletotrichum truncatum]KAF6786087.1 thioredoxin-like protein [Colletotrichum truncatum]